MDLNSITKRIKELEKNLDICPHCGEGLAPDMKEKICPDCEQPLFENGEEAELETLKQLIEGV